jgi:hypothetical protein
MRVLRGMDLADKREAMLEAIMFDKMKDLFRAMNPKNRIWPLDHDDPRVKGPQPRILSDEAVRELCRRSREAQGDAGLSHAQESNSKGGI